MQSGTPVQDMPTASGSHEETLPRPQQHQPDRSVPELPGYEVLRRLGHGGMGAVWSAIQLGTGRRVAVKLLASSLFESSQARRRFHREVRLTAKLDHPNVARIFDSGVHQGAYFFAMEVIDGWPLDEYTRQRGLTRRQILDLFLQVCDGVAHAHVRGMIHRDLKPSNILVTFSGQVKIVDFGLAKSVADRTLGPKFSSDPGQCSVARHLWAEDKLWQDAQDATAATISVGGQLAGTPAYMSPEQAVGNAVDRRTDVYSLGLILHKLLTGRDVRSRAMCDSDLLRQVSGEDISRTTPGVRSVDRGIQSVLLKALARDPELRYATAGEIAEDIRS